MQALSAGQRRARHHRSRPRGRSAHPRRGRCRCDRRGLPGERGCRPPGARPLRPGCGASRAGSSRRGSCCYRDRRARRPALGWCRTMPGCRRCRGRGCRPPRGRRRRRCIRRLRRRPGRRRRRRRWRRRRRPRWGPSDRLGGRAAGQQRGLGSASTQSAPDRWTVRMRPCSNSSANAPEAPVARRSPCSRKTTSLIDIASTRRRR